MLFHSRLLQVGFPVVAALFVSPLVSAPAGEKAAEKSILIFPTDQNRNIGDQAHGPAAARLFRIHCPDVRVDIYHRNPLTRRHLPEVGDFNGAIETYHLLTTSSAPQPIGLETMQHWQGSNPEKPFGMFGVTVNRLNRHAFSILDGASFFFTRDTRSLEVARHGSGTAEDPGELALVDQVPRIEFVPDCVFAFDLADEERATAFLESKELVPGEFLAVVPILRRTPAGTRLEKGPFHEYTDARAGSMARNRETMEHDFGILRDVIVRWVRETGKKVLLCPEMTYAMDCFDELILERLPEDVRPFVEKRGHEDGWWQADEASSVYRRAFAMVSMDNHSPILAVNQGVPLLFPSPRTGKKEQMWNDIGLSDWFWHGVDDLPDGAPVADKLMEIHGNPEAARRKVRRARELVRTRHLHAIGALRESIGLPFVADRDEDGIADVWEGYHHGGAEQCDPDADPDGNGMSHLLEYAVDAPLGMADPAEARPEFRVEDRDGERWLMLEWRRNLGAPQLDYRVVKVSGDGETSALDRDGVVEKVLDPDPDGDGSAELRSTAIRSDDPRARLELRMERKDVDRR